MVPDLSALLTEHGSAMDGGTRLAVVKALILLRNRGQAGGKGGWWEGGEVRGRGFSVPARPSPTTANLTVPSPAPLPS